MSSYDQQQQAPFVKGNFDYVVGVSLRGALWRVEPSPAVWVRIELALNARPDEVADSSPLRRFFGRLHHYALFMESILFSTPGWHERLAQQRMSLFAQVLAYPHMQLAVV